MSLSETLKSFVDSQVSEGDYTSGSDYLREMLLEGAASPPSPLPMDAEYFENLRKRIRGMK